MKRMERTRAANLSTTLTPARLASPSAGAPRPGPLLPYRKEAIMPEDVNGAGAGESSGSDAGQEDMSPEAFRALSPAMEDDRFTTTIRFRGELHKPAMTGEGTEDELTVKVKVAGFDLSDLHHSLRPYAGRMVEALILPLRVAEEKLPWETPPHPDQTRLPLEGEAQEAVGQFVCIACGAACEIGEDGHCPACGGALRPREEASAGDQVAEQGDAHAEEDQHAEEDSAE